MEIHGKTYSGIDFPTHFNSVCYSASQTFPSHFQWTSSNGSLKQNYPVPVQMYDDDPRRSNAVPGNEHSLIFPHEESSTAVYQAHQFWGTIRQQQTNTVSTTPLDNAYHHLLRKIIKSLSTEEVEDLCFISTEANSSSVRNKANFSGMVLFKFFEQRMLISAENLEYLQNHLKNIYRMDLCHLIDEYNNNHLRGPSFSHSVQLAEPLPQSSQLKFNPSPTNVGPHPSSSVGSRPPPFNPEYHDKTQSQLPQHDPVQYTHPEQINTSDHQQECSYPTQEEGDEEFKSQQSLQTDNLIFHNGAMHTHSSSEQLFQQNKELHMKLTISNNEICVLSKKNDQLQQSLQQIRSELNTEREMSQQQVNNQKQIHKHYLAQIEKLCAQLQGKSGPVAERYPMCKHPHGIALIVNNYEFSFTHHVEKALPNREGSLVDENNLCVTWEYLGYKVQVLKNLKASEFTRELMQVALQSHENYDSFVCCILSHGYLDGVYGTDGELVKFNDIVKLFKDNFCPTLVGKPKLFFIQACRGDNKDERVYEQKDGPDKIKNSLPSEADFFFGYATPPGYASWRSREYGSWYISSLCEVLVDNAPQQDLLSMLTMVTNKVSEAYTKEGYK
ncbi:uncharacterized protein [Dysidea avara]|uniref:uncharacterized protein isoform X1 n=2 Tax=Dysidea avara TaxID=196820 RepID=UPI0033175B91